MRKRKQRKIGEITLNLLEQIATMTEGVAYSFLDHKKIKRLLKYGGKMESERLFDYLRGLKKSGYIEFKREKNNLSIRLTNKGHIKLIENARDNKIDGHWRLISFDIPEELRTKRNLFRSSIRRIGFRQVQQSLWACPFSRADKIEQIIDYYELNMYVAYFIVEKCDIENHLKTLFKDAIKK
jgi:DNA-binding transcriptional regulator PaaX